jgi:hypothetical protein
MVYVDRTPESDTRVESGATPYTGSTIDEGVGNGCMIDNSAVLESHGTEKTCFNNSSELLII